MGEVLAVVGGIAASAQLFHYGSEFLAAAAALPGHVRHAPDRLQSWLGRLSTMKTLIDEAHSRISTKHRGIRFLLAECRKHTDQLGILLQPWLNRSAGQARGRLENLAFILWRQRKIEMLLLSFNRDFKMLTSILLL